MKKHLSLLPLIGLLIASLGLVVVPAAAQDELLTFAAPDCDYGGKFRSIEAVDRLTVRVTLCNVDVAFSYNMASVGLLVFPREFLEANGGAGDLLTSPIGTGPLKVERWDTGSEIVFSRFDDYWGEPSIEPTVILRWNSEAAARATELRAGTIDGMKFANPSDVPSIGGGPTVVNLLR
jgi:ABC-type transport system substrate-binding protein